jgi:hypothetical protein
MSGLSYKDFQNARSLVARTPTAVPYSDPSAVLSARFDAGLLTGTLGPQISTSRSVDDFADWWEKKTGSPFDEAASAWRQSQVEAGVHPRRLPGLRSAQVADALNRKYREDHPGEPDVPGFTSERAKALAREAETTATELESRAGTLGDTASIVGDLSSAILSPESLATMFFAPARVGVLGWRAVGRVAAREAGIGVATEIPAQVVVQDWRKQLGLPSGFWQGAANVAAVGGLSAAFGGAVRGVLEVRNAIRAGKTVEGTVARRLYDTLSEEDRATLANSWGDSLAVEGVITRQFETDPAFRDRLTTTEREAIERAVEARNASRPFDVRSLADAQAVERAVLNASISLETGFAPPPGAFFATPEPTVRVGGFTGRIPAPFRATATPAELEAVTRAAEAAPEGPLSFRDLARTGATLKEVQDAIDSGKITLGPRGEMTREALRQIGELPKARPPEPQMPRRFRDPPEEVSFRELQDTGATLQEVQNAVARGQVVLGPRGEITREALEQIRALPDARVSASMAGQNVDPRLEITISPEPLTPKILEDLQTMSSALPEGRAIIARLDEDEVATIAAKSDDALAEEGEASLRARVERAGSADNTDTLTRIARETLAEVDELDLINTALEACRFG